jgi:hypothetical protein
MVPVVGVDHAPTTAFATEACTLSPDPPISVPASGSLLVHKQLQVGSATGRGETPPSVSDNAVLTIVVTNYRSFSTRLWSPIVHYHPPSR